MSQRLELLNIVFPRLRELSETGGKSAVKRYFANRFGEEPMDKGSELYFNEWVMRFNAQEQLLELSANSRLARAIPD